MERYNDTNTPMIAFVGVVSTVVLFAAIVGLQVLYYTLAEQDYRRKVVEAPTIESDGIIAEQQIQLTQYGWLDREQNKVAIPIDRAMERVVADLQALAGKE
jgi:hypothetical protein